MASGARDPGLVVLTTPGHWVIGALAKNQWSFAAWGNKSVDALLVQPFIPHGWYVTTSPIITANWEAASNERWTMPIGGGVGKIVKLGKLPINLQLQAFDNVVTPNRSGADWQLRFQAQLLFPKSRRTNHDCESYRPIARRGTPPDTGSSHTGFRCVISGDDVQVRSVEREPSLAKYMSSTQTTPQLTNPKNQ
jgi:hypothetical protein